MYKHIIIIAALLVGCDSKAPMDTDTDTPMWRDDLPDQVVIVFDGNVGNEDLVYATSAHLQGVVDDAPTTWGVAVVYGSGGVYSTLQEVDSIDPLEVDLMPTSSFLPFAYLEKANGDTPLRETIWWYIVSARDSEDEAMPVLPEGHIIVPWRPGLPVLDEAADFSGGFPCDGAFGCLYEG